MRIHADLPFGASTDELAGLLSCVCSLVFLAWLVLWRLSGFLVKWPNLPAEQSTLRWVRRLSRATIVLLVPAFSVPVLFIYRELARPLPPKEAITADPNGYDDLLRAADRLSNVVVPYAKEMTPAARTKFVANHKAALKQIRTGLSRKCQVSLSYTTDDLSSSFYESWQLARALDMEAEVAANEGRMADAARNGVDCMRLGSAVSGGGLENHWFFGDHIESFGFHRVVEVSRGLTADECHEVLDAIDVIDSEREALSAVLQRDHGWSQRVWGWRDSLARAVCGLAGVEYETDLTWIEVRNEASTRLLQTDLAMLAFQLEHSRYPDDLDEVVPGLLKRIPVDPYSDKPLVHRREGNEYFLYSAGPNGVDEGGQRVSWEQYIEGKGDLFLDTLTESR